MGVAEELLIVHVEAFMVFIDIIRYVRWDGDSVGPGVQ